MNKNELKNRLFQRKWKVDLLYSNGIMVSIKELRIKFEIEKNREMTANKLSLSIYNLGKSYTGELLEDKNTKVYLYAGYVNSKDLPILFAGDITEIVQERNNADIVVNIKASDGGKALENAHFVKQYPPNVDLKDIYKDAVDSLISVGNIVANKIKEKVSTIINGKSVKTKSQKGFSFNESTKKAINKLNNRLGIESSIENNNFVLFDPDNKNKTNNKVVRLSEETGLIGIPAKKLFRKKRKSKESYEGIEFISLLIPELYEVGTGVKIRSYFLETDGADEPPVYHIRSSKIVGDTHSNQWYIKGIAV